MLSTIIGKETRDIIGSTKFAVTFAVCATLILLSFYVGAKSYKVSQEQYEAATAENLRQLEGLTDWFGIQQHRIFLPPQPLEALVTGVSYDIGRTTEIQGRGELTATDSRFNEDPIFAIFRFLDLGFMFQIVISLFAILLGYDAISGEKERGTLRLAFANAVPRATYILGKLIGSFLALAVPLSVAIILGCLLLPLLGVPMSASDWVRLSLVIFAGLLYFGAFLTLSVFISSVTQRSSSSFLLLLVIWIMAVMIVPRASVLLAGRYVDVPSVDEIASQKSRMRAQLWEEHRRDLGSFKPTNTEDMEQMVSELNRFMEERADERDKKMMEFASRLNEDRFNRQQIQQKLAFNLARISPASSLTFATSALAGTSLALKSHYNKETTEYQTIYGNFMKEKTGINPGGRMMVIKTTMEGEEEPESIDPEELPKFVYKPIGLAESIEAATVDLGLLALFNILFFSGAFVAFIRYDVR